MNPTEEQLRHLAEHLGVDLALVRMVSHTQDESVPLEIRNSLRADLGLPPILPTQRGVGLFQTRWSS